MSALKNVQPLRSLEKIEDMKWSLKQYCGERDYILFLIGINTGLRCGDLLKLKTNQLLNKKKVNVKEGKTQKTRTLVFSEVIYSEVQDYVKCNSSEWLFPSRKGDKAISPTQAYRQLNKAGEMVDIYEGIGNHTMRKTFGYWFYKQHKDIAKLQMILNHSHPEVTKRYIGITQDEIEESLSNFSL